VADRELTMKPQVSGDLLRAPVCLQLPRHQSEVGLREVLIPAGTGPSSIRSLDGFAGSVRAIPPGAVPPDLSRDRAPVAPQPPGNLCCVESLTPQRCNRVLFFRGDLAIGHCRFSELGRWKNRGTSQVTSSECRVALTL
jgi:hypothetical protein